MRLFYQILFLKRKNNFSANISNSCSLNIFEPKIWRRLGTFPSCFFFSWQSHSGWSTFYNFHDPLTATLVTSTGTWHRGYGFFEVCQVQPWPKIFFCRFFWLCDTFFRKFFKYLQRVPLHFFLFCKRMDVQKLPKAPLSDLPQTKKIRKKNRKKFQKKFGNFFNFFLTRVL